MVMVWHNVELITPHYHTHRMHAKAIYMHHSVPCTHYAYRIVRYCLSWHAALFRGMVNNASSQNHSMGISLAYIVGYAT